MKNKKKLFYAGALAVIIILIAVVFFVSIKIYQIKKNNGKNISSTSQGIELKKDSSSPIADDSADSVGDNYYQETSISDESVSELLDNMPIDMPTDITENSYLDLTDSDCRNGCSEFNDPDDLKYCKEYCDIEEAKITTENCDDLEGLDQDYCFKHQALREKNLSICEVISDENIKKSCNKQKI